MARLLSMLFYMLGLFLIFKDNSLAVGIPRVRKKRFSRPVAPTPPLKEGEVPIITYHAPSGMGPCVARFIYKGYKYDEKIFSVFIAHLVTLKLVRLRECVVKGYLLETLEDCEAFEKLPPAQYHLVSFLLGTRFNKGRFFKFALKNDEKFYEAQELFERHLRNEAFMFPGSRPEVFGFREYLKVGEQTRLPEAKPTPEHELRWIRKNLHYISYAMAFDLENVWAKEIGHEIFDAYRGLGTENHQDYMTRMRIEMEYGRFPGKF